MINDRISELIVHLEMNANSFAESIGVKSAVIYNIVKGRRSKPSFEVLQKILMSFQTINANWLLRGEGDLSKEESKEESSEIIQQDKSYSRIEDRMNFLISEIRKELPDNYSVEELHELLTTLINENVNQKFKIISLYEKQDQIIDLLRKKLNLSI